MDRLLRLLLRVYPRGFRRRYGDELLAQVRCDVAEAAKAGGTFLTWTRHLAGFLLAGLQERAVGIMRVGSRSRRDVPSHTGTGSTLAGKRVAAAEFRFAWRSLRRRPGFTIASIGILALGLAATVSVFSMAIATLNPQIRGVDHVDPLVSIFQYSTRDEYHSGVSLPTWQDYRESLSDLEGLAAFSSTPANLVRDDGSERLQAQMVSLDYFQVLRVRPALGRGFSHDADRERRAAVISFHTWRQDFGSDPNVVGRSLRLDDARFTVVGVAPEGFRGLELDTPADVWVTLDARDVLTSYSEEMVRGRGMHWLTTVGRLRSGVGLSRLRTEASAVASALADAYPESQAGWEVRVLPLTEAVIWPGQRERIRAIAVMLGGVVALFLLLSCVTLAGMALADLRGRQHESAVRLALGAQPAHLVRHELARSLLLAGPAMILGLWGGDALVRGAVAWGLVPSLPAGLGLRPNRSIVIDILGLLPILVLLIGAFPAYHAADSQPFAAMRRRPGGRERSTARLRRMLSALQVAISVAVLSVAGSLVLSARAELNHRLGFDGDGVLLASVDPQLSGFDETQRRVLYARAQEMLAGLPGVESVAAAAFVPFSGPRLGAQIRYDDGAGGKTEINVTGNIVSSGYFATLRIPLLAGVDLPAEERTGAIPIVLNEAAARRLWGRQDPLGRKLDLGAWLGGEAVVVGVAGDLGVGRELLADATPSIFLPLWSRPWPSATFHVRVTAGQAGAVVEAVRRVMASLDPAMPVYDVRTLSGLVQAARTPALAAAGAVGLLGVLGMLLAGAGIYGVVAQAVAERRHEFGVRLAVGAGRRGILGQVLREGAFVFVVGAVAGVPAALALAGLLKSLLFTIRPVNPISLGSALLLTAAATAVALVVPARRASHVSPMDALRAD